MIALERSHQPYGIAPSRNAYPRGSAQTAHRTARSHRSAPPALDTQPTEPSPDRGHHRPYARARHLLRGGLGRASAGTYSSRRAHPIVRQTPRRNRAPHNGDGQETRPATVANHHDLLSQHSSLSGSLLRLAGALAVTPTPYLLRRRPRRVYSPLFRTVSCPYSPSAARRGFGTQTRGADHEQ